MGFERAREEAEWAQVGEIRAEREARERAEAAAARARETPGERAAREQAEVDAVARATARAELLASETASERYAREAREAAAAQPRGKFGPATTGSLDAWSKMQEEQRAAAVAARNAEAAARIASRRASGLPAGKF